MASDVPRSSPRSDRSPPRSDQSYPRSGACPAPHHPSRPPPQACAPRKIRSDPPPPRRNSIKPSDHVLPSHPHIPEPPQCHIMLSRGQYKRPSRPDARPACTGCASTRQHHPRHAASTPTTHGMLHETHPRPSTVQTPLEMGLRKRGPLTLASLQPAKTANACHEPYTFELY